MKKSFLVLLFIIPILSFSQQLPREEQKSIDTYANSACDCVNNLINTLDSGMVEYLQIFADSGETAAQTFLNEYLTSVTEEDASALLKSANLMQTEAFGIKIEACEDRSNLSEKSNNEIDNESGGSYDYFIKALSVNQNCKLMKLFLEMGNSIE